MVTIKEVAQLAGVSTSTVSRALSGRIPVDAETKNKVLAAVEKLGYRPNALAKGLKEGKTNTIGLIIPNIRNPIFPAVARGVEDVARKNGYTVILCNTDENLEVELDYLDKLQKRWVDGLIFATAKEESGHILKLRAQGFPVVLLVRKMKDSIDAVVADNYGGGYKAACHLVEKGCTRIAVINGSMEIDLYRERLEGFKDALRDRGILLEEGLVITGIADNRDGYEAMLSLLDKPGEIDGVFAANDSKAIGAVKAVRDRGIKVPGSIKIIGFDGLEASEIIEPPLTTIVQPTYHMGARAAQRLIKLMDAGGEEEPLVEVLEVELAQRGTT